MEVKYIFGPALERAFREGVLREVRLYTVLYDIGRIITSDTSHFIK